MINLLRRLYHHFKKEETSFRQEDQTNYDFHSDMPSGPEDIEIVYLPKRYIKAAEEARRRAREAELREDQDPLVRAKEEVDRAMFYKASYDGDPSTDWYALEFLGNKGIGKILNM